MQVLTGAGEGGGRQFLHGCPGIEHRDPVGDLQRAHKVVRDEHHPCAGIGRRAQPGQRLGDDLLVEPRGRLIGDDEPRRADRGRRSDDPARHPAGQLVGEPALGPLRQVEAAVRRRHHWPWVVHAGQRSRPTRLPADPGNGVEERHGLRHERDRMTPQGRPPRLVEGRAVEAHGAPLDRVRRQQPQHRVRQQALPRPRRAHHGHQLARAHLQVEPRHHLQSAAAQPGLVLHEVDLQVADLQQGAT